MSKYRIKEPMPQYGANTARIVDVPDEVVNQIRADVIDDFAKASITMYEKYDIDDVFRTSDTYSYTNACCIFENYIEEIAEELKAGVNNE